MHNASCSTRFSSCLPQRENPGDFDTSNSQPLIRYDLLCRSVLINRMVLNRNPVQIFLTLLYVKILVRLEEGIKKWVNFSLIDQKFKKNYISQVHSSLSGKFNHTPAEQRVTNYNTDQAPICARSNSRAPLSMWTFPWSLGEIDLSYPWPFENVAPQGT